MTKLSYWKDRCNRKLYSALQSMTNLKSPETFELSKGVNRTLHQSSCEGTGRIAAHCRRDRMLTNNAILWRRSLSNRVCRKVLGGTRTNTRREPSENRYTTHASETVTRKNPSKRRRRPPTGTWPMKTGFGLGWDSGWRLRLEPEMDLYRGTPATNTTMNGHRSTSTCRRESAFVTKTLPYRKEQRGIPNLLCTTE